MIFDVLNGAVIDDARAVSSQILKASLVDGEIYDKLATKWKINLDALLKKIDNLSGAEIYFLQEFVSKFWEGWNLNLSLDEYIELI